MSDVAIDLINRGVSVEQSNHNGETPLTLACKRDLSDVVKALLKAGANPGIKTELVGCHFNYADHISKNAIRN